MCCARIQSGVLVRRKFAPMLRYAETLGLRGAPQLNLWQVLPIRARFVSRTLTGGQHIMINLMRCPGMER